MILLLLILKKTCYNWVHSQSRVVKNRHSTLDVAIWSNRHPAKANTETGHLRIKYYIVTVLSCLTCSNHRSMFTMLRATYELQLLFSIDETKKVTYAANAIYLEWNSTYSLRKSTMTIYYIGKRNLYRLLATSNIETGKHQLASIVRRRRITAIMWFYFHW